MRIEPLIGTQASAPPLYPDGAPAPAGSTIRRTRLARTLRELASHGRDALYSGEVGAGITKASLGSVTADDLAVDQAEWIEPARLDVYGTTAWTIPPNSQGYLTLASAWITERLDWSRDPDDPAFAHACIEAYRAMAWERDDLVSDPATAPLAPSELLSVERLAERATSLSADATTPWPAIARRPGGTAFMCTLDSGGMGVSFIQSNFHGIGSGLSAGATGVFLHNRGAGFNLFEDHPNEYRPGNRPLHTLAPTLWTRDDRLALILGTRGGHQQPQLLAQVAAFLLHGGDTPPQAQLRPR